MSAVAADAISASLWRQAGRRFARNRVAMASVVLLALITLAVIVVPMAWPHGIEDAYWENILIPPTLENWHWFGTDANGRDLFVRTLYGGRISLAIGVLTTVVALAIGVTYGAVAGFAGGRLDGLMMRFVDVLYSLPLIFFIIILVTVFGRNIFLVFVGIGAVEWLTMSRIVRGQTLSVKTREFVEAAVAIGMSRGAILRRHVVPNVLGPVIVYVYAADPARSTPRSIRATAAAPRWPTIRSFSASPSAVSAAATTSGTSSPSRRLSCSSRTTPTAAMTGKPALFDTLQTFENPALRPFLNVGKEPVYEKKLLVDAKDVRVTAHRITDALLGALTGRPGGFASHFVYSGRWGTKSYRVFSMDADGHDLKPLSDPNDTAIAPAWGPNQAIFYGLSKNYSPYRLMRFDGAKHEKVNLPFSGYFRLPALRTALRMFDK